MQFSTELSNELHGGRRGTTRGEHVVDNEDPLPARHRVLVNLEGVRAVLEVVGFLNRFRRQFAGFPDRNEPGPDLLRDSRSENEAAAFDADDRIDSLSNVRCRQQIDGRLEAKRIAQQRGDVVEEDAGLGEIRNAANVLFQVPAMNDLLVPFDPVLFDPLVLFDLFVPSCLPFDSE